MRFLTCGECGILVELTDLDETLRIFAALRAFQKTDMPPETSQDALRAVTQLIPAAHTILISFDPLIASRTAVIAAVRTLDASDDVCRRS